jgi:hypothetical protein
LLVIAKAIAQFERNVVVVADGLLQVVGKSRVKAERSTMPLKNAFLAFFNLAKLRASSSRLAKHRVLDPSS